MSFTLLDEESVTEKDTSSQEEVKGKTFSLEEIVRGIKGVPHQAASSAATVTSVGMGLPGDILGLFNDLVAAPLVSKITGKPGVKYEKTPLGKLFPGSTEIEEDIHKLIPYTKPRNSYESSTNDIIGTASSLLLPGAQAKVGRFLKTNPITRAFFKSIGSHLFGEAIKDVTGDEAKGEMAKAGSLFTMSLLDRQGVGKFVSSVYNKASAALKNAGNPQVNATRISNQLLDIKNKLSKGTLAPSESAVIQDIDKALAHIKDGKIPVENLWGISRSLTERSMEAQRAAPSKANRIRARKFYNSLSNAVNKELSEYGKINKDFGGPFEAAQKGFSTLARSNAIENWIGNTLKYNPATTGLLHLFGGGLGATAVKGGGLSVQSTLAPAAAYQVSKLLYRIKSSPLLRRYYFTALQAASREDAQTFNRALKKMDQSLQKLEEKQKNFKLLD